jgi:hypothetical protein
MAQLMNTIYDYAKNIFSDFDGYKSVSRDVITDAFASLPGSNHFMQLLVNAHCLHWGYHSSSADFRERLNELPHLFLLMTWERYASIRDETGPSFLDDRSWCHRWYSELDY